MRFAKSLLTLCLGAVLLGGCARAARDTTGFAINDSVTVAASFEDTWQGVKRVLRDRDLVVDTRDTRGRFVAFEGSTGSNLIRNVRTRYVIELGKISESETAVYIETLREVYGTTLLTSPDWHARPAKDNAEASAILEALVAKLSGVDTTVPDETAGEVAPATEEPVPAEPPVEAGEPAIEDASAV
jgi:hypothetical protein